MKGIMFLLYFLFGSIFVYAGIVKVLDPGIFLLDVRSFALLPDPYAAWLAIFLPWLEIFAGLSVITGIFRRGGLLLLNTCLVIFLGALFIAWVRGTDIRCGCFGNGDESGTAAPRYLWYVSRDAGLLAFGLFLAYRIARSTKHP